MPVIFPRKISKVSIAAETFLWNTSNLSMKYQEGFLRKVRNPSVKNLDCFCRELNITGISQEAYLFINGTFQTYPVRFLLFSRNLSYKKWATQLPIFFSETFLDLFLSPERFHVFSSFHLFFMSTLSKIVFFFLLGLEIYFFYSIPHIYWL